jgi:AbiV family abortive infection protein
MQAIPLQHIEAGRRKLLANAQALVQEADLLLANQHFARAYALAHLASEELGKLPMYVRAGMESALGHAVDWKALGAKATNHTRKLNALHALDYFQSDIRVDNSDHASYVAALSTTPALNARKNASLYVSITPQGTTAPAEAIDALTAAAMVARAKEVLNYFETTERLTAGQIEALTQDPSKARFFQILKDFEDGKFD